MRLAIGLPPGPSATAVSHPGPPHPAPRPQSLSQALQQGGEVPWEERTAIVFGQEVLQPRLVAYMADDPSLAYTYSGVQSARPPRPATPRHAARPPPRLSPRG